MITVLVVDDLISELDRLWGIKQGIDVYVTKPFGREEIVRAVKSVVR